MVDPAEKRTELYAQLDQAQALIGGMWLNVDDASPTGCLIDGEEGVAFTGLRASNDAASHDKLAEVAELWQGLGFVTVAKNDVPPYDLIIATSPIDPENFLVFGLSENAMYLDAQSACGHGDLYEWVLKGRQEIADQKAKERAKLLEEAGY